MMKIFFAPVLALISLSSFAQEDEKPLVAVKNKVYEPDIYNPHVRVETFVEITDSIDYFIENIQELFGNTEEESGVFIWNNVLIDSITGKLKIQMAHGLLSYRSDKDYFRQCSSSGRIAIKKNEIRCLRLRFFLDKGNDALRSEKNKTIIMELIYSLLTPKDTEETDSE